jgi:hypothetical protein
LSTDEFGGYQKNGFTSIESIQVAVGLSDNCITKKAQSLLYGNKSKSKQEDKLDSFDTNETSN